MITLSNDQFDKLSKSIKEKGLTYQPLIEELVDHYACLIEQEMSRGLPFDVAFQLVLNTILPEELKDTQKRTLLLLNHKTILMKRINWSIAISVCLFFLTLFVFNKTEFTEQPELADNLLNTNISETTSMFVHEKDPPSRSPLDKKLTITSTFGMRLHPILKKEKMHKGIDLKAGKGTPVYATADGLVEKVITHNGYGKLIVLKHDEVYQTYYAQLSVFEVKTGDIVKKGDLIGRVGSSGLSTAPHLHYEVLKNGKRVDPEKYF